MSKSEQEENRPRGPKARNAARKKRHQDNAPIPGSSHHRKRGDRDSGPATMHETDETHNKNGKGGSRRRWRP